MASSIVIKVKFGETLRRFNALVVDGKLDLDMVRLRGKILNLFNFAPDADYALTYIDEDGDVVTLADEDDLHDVVMQSLNPLRINVNLNTEKAGKSSARSSRSSTPMRSSQDDPSLQILNSSVSEVLKSAPEPLRYALSKLFSDVASKAASSTAGIAELVDGLSKVGLTNLSQFSEFRPEFSTPNVASGSTTDKSGSEAQNSKKAVESRPENLPDTKSGTRTDFQAEKSPKANIDGKNTVTKSVDGSGVSALGVYASSVSAGHNVNNVPLKNKEVNSSLPRFLKPVGHSFANVNGMQPTNASAAEEKKGTVKYNESRVGYDWNPTGFGSSNPDYLKHCLQDSQNIGVGGSSWAKPLNASGSSPAWNHSLFNSVNECPFTGVPLLNELPAPPPPFPFASRVPPFKRSHNHNDGIGSIFHRGVRCDGCGVHPITGPRFKSKVKEDYDLCSICFAGMGSEADYVRIDRPLTPRHHLPFRGMYDAPRMRPPSLPHILRGSGTKSSRPKLDSRFVQDVNVLDGTLMAPGTPFTKIWRMRNNGTIVWPQGSQLLWIGGDRLSNTLSVEVEIPSDGLPVDKELDIAIDFTAPECPGRYISYWRMASPTGQKFGQRVWVLIQVDATLKESGGISIHGYDLNLPPVSSAVTGPEVDEKQPPMEGSSPDPFSFNFPRVTELVDPISVSNANLNKDLFPSVMELSEPNPVLDANTNKDQDLNFPINDNLLIGGSTSGTRSTELAASRISYPNIDFSEGESYLPVPAQPSFSAVDLPENITASASLHAPSYPEVAGGSATHEDVGIDEREQSLLMDLQEMGFNQVELNREVLRMNEYDLEQSVEYLCGVEEWDPILEELQEMGFTDQEANKRLLRKNNGSIKRVVMDLIKGEMA